MNPQANEFLQLARSPFKFGMFLFAKLPAAFFSGVRVADITPEKTAVVITHRWFNQNPFRSIYFACLAMAAEMSTGLLAMLHVYKRNPAVSMLVVKAESEYFKKATGKITFTCKDGEQVQLAVEEAVVTHEPVSCTTKSIGLNEKGEVVAVFVVTWSFKVRQKSGGSRQ